MFRKTFFALTAILALSSASLPLYGPVPAPRPAPAPPVEPAPSQTAPAQTAPAQTAPAQTAPKKTAPATNPAEAEKEKPAEPQPVAPPAPAILAESAGEHALCITALKEIGASFREDARIDDGDGCGIDKPLTLTAALAGIKVEPAATILCETALALARWTKEAVQPAAKAALSEEGPLTVINQASGYVCRLRNNAATGKISEHARGNAIDIASFTFKSGKTLEIQPRDEDSTLSGAFQRAVTATGCLYFTTVLDPGSDEAHEDHLHLDVLQRKNGFRYCH